MSEKTVRVEKGIDARASLFGRLAMDTGLVSYQNIVDCIETQEKARALGQAPQKIGEILIEKGILTQAEVTMIIDMQSNPAGLIGRILIEKKIITPEQLRECLDEQLAIHQKGLAPPLLSELVVRKGFASSEKVASLLVRKEAKENVFGDFLVANNLVSQADVDNCISQQNHVPGKEPQKLGELLVENGVLTSAEAELYFRRYIQSRRNYSSLPTPFAARKDKGAVIKGDFHILNTLGQHKDGVTYQARHMLSGAVVTTHVFIGTETLDKDEPDADHGAFKDKLEKALKLRHPSMQRLFADEVVDSSRILSVEYVQGHSLATMIAGGEKIDWFRAVKIAHDFASLLKAADEAGLHHDDIRPGSILIDTNGRAKLSLWAYTEDPIVNRDWVAQKYGEIPFTFAPERQTAPPSARTDMFSLGATLIHAITGKPVMTGISFAKAVKNFNHSDILQNLAMDLNLPLGLISILTRLADPDQKNRYDDYDALLADLEKLGNTHGLDFTDKYGRKSITNSMLPPAASDAIADFLSTAMVMRGIGRISYARLSKIYALPAVIMILVMIACTGVYRATQASSGLMVRANWRDQQGDKAGALALYQQISEIFPDAPIVQQRYYDLAMEQHDYGEAEMALTRLMDIHPEHRSQYLETLGDLQVWQKRYVSALDIYREVAASKPSDLDIRIKMADAMLWGKDYAEAEKNFAELYAADPSNQDYALGLIRSAMENKDTDTAIRTFNSINGIMQFQDSVIMEYAWMLKGAGKEDDLKKIAASVVQSSRFDSFSKTDQTYLYYWAGDYNAAVKLLTELTSTSPNDKEFLLFRISINDQIGNVDAVIADYVTLSNLDPDNTTYLTTLAGLYQRRQDFEKANEYLRRALAKKEGDAEIELAIAENLSYMGKNADAVSWYQKVIAKLPNNARVLKGMVQSMIWSGEYSNALEFVERLYKNNPADHVNNVNLALVYTHVGKGELAKPIVKKLITADELTAEDVESLIGGALAANDNSLLLTLVGSEEGDSTKIEETRLTLARRLRAQKQHDLSLPFYAAVLAHQKSPDPKLLMEMAESASWAGHNDIATEWLEVARDILKDEQSNPTSETLPRDRFQLSNREWDAILEPLKKNPDVFRSLQGFKEMFGRIDERPQRKPDTANSSGN